jgi:hypothetical protein
MLLYGQVEGISAVYDDSFVEWVIVTTDTEDNDGELGLTYGLSSDRRTDWSYRIGDLSGEISQVSGSDGRLWRLTSPDGNINLRRVWSGDNSEWEISDGYQSIVLAVRYANNAEEWRIKDESVGYLDVFTLYERDARDWVIEESLGDAYRVEFKLAALFLAMFVATGS